MAKYFVTPFGSSGDLTTVPDASQTDGSVSYADGFGPDYALDPDTDSSALDIARGNMNDLFYQITLAIQNLQQWYAPSWISASDNDDVDFPYPVGARVLYTDGNVYKSLIDDNTGTPGVSANWIVVDSDLVTLTDFNETVAGLVTTDTFNDTVSDLEAAIALKAPLASPGLTGTPTAPTASAGTSTTQIATTSFVSTAISNMLSALFVYSLKWPGASSNTGYIKIPVLGVMFQWARISVADDGTSTLTLSKSYSSSSFLTWASINYSANDFESGTQSCWAAATSTNTVAVSFENTQSGSQASRDVNVMCFGPYSS